MSLKPTLHSLKKRGMLDSVTGTKGGYWLKPGGKRTAQALLKN